MLARVSHRFQYLSEPEIYSTFLLRRSDECQLLENAISSNPQRARYVRRLDLLPDAARADDFGDSIANIARRFTLLQELTVESPTCNYGRRATGSWWNYAETMITRSLTTALSSTAVGGLMKLILHLDGIGTRYWNPQSSLEARGQGWSRIMALNTLTELTVSCACIHDELSLGEPTSSNLRILRLIECNVDNKGLYNILSAPKALEVLYLGDSHTSDHFELQYTDASKGRISFTTGKAMIFHLIICLHLMACYLPAIRMLS